MTMKNAQRQWNLCNAKPISSLAESIQSLCLTACGKTQLETLEQRGSAVLLVKKSVGFPSADSLGSGAPDTVGILTSAAQRQNQRDMLLGGHSREMSESGQRTSGTWWK